VLVDRPSNQIVYDMVENEVLISRKGMRIRRYGKWEKKNYQWFKILWWITQRSFQQHIRYG